MRFLNFWWITWGKKLQPKIFRWVFETLGNFRLHLTQTRIVPIFFKYVKPHFWCREFWSHCQNRKATVWNKPNSFLSAAIGQRPRNYLRSCCFCCSCCSPFGSIPHLNQLKKYSLVWDLNPLPPDNGSIALSTELPWLRYYNCKKCSK